LRRPRLSIVIPCFNEAENIVPLYRALKAELDTVGQEWEVVLVDDGSTDATVEVAASIAMEDHRLVIVKLRRNFGQTPALVAGLDHAEGEIVVTMDADLQNDPADIGRLLARLDEGYDMVAGWRRHRQDHALLRLLPSRIANGLISRLLGTTMHDNGCTLRAYRKAELLANVPLYSDMHRFIPAIAASSGMRTTEIEVRHHPRRFGQSKYGLSRVHRVFLDLLALKTLLSFTSRPMLCFGLLALPFAFLSMLAVMMEFYRLLVMDADLSLPIAGTGLIFFVTAVFMVCAGALADLIVRLGDVHGHEFFKSRRMGRRLR
jgi:glycosyltransferase involved in cell wall biosynthesis